MNSDLSKLQPYPFEKLRKLFAGVEANPDQQPIAMSIGEPKHPSPQRVIDTIAENLPRLSSYPSTLGLPELRNAIAVWLKSRFGLNGIDPDEQVLPVNGTREALFAFAQAVVKRDTQASVMCPNPFYQIYEGAALLAGATPVFLNCLPENNFLPDFDSVTEQQWQACQLLYLCSPGNPTGAVIGLPQLQKLIQLAQEHDFIIASDECYSEIYPIEEQAPPGLLQACASLGDDDYRNCVVFHSLSKRSNLPGLRSGFVAGDASVLKAFFQYRTYHGCAMPVHHQLGSIAAWSDESHVVENRALYQKKFATVLNELRPHIEVNEPEAGFYLWLKTPIEDTEFAQALYAQENLAVLPGRFLARHANGVNPGDNRVRIALVAPIDECIEGARRIVRTLEGL